MAAGEAPGAEPHRGNEAEGTNPQPRWGDLTLPFSWLWPARLAPPGCPLRHCSHFSASPAQHAPLSSLCSAAKGAGAPAAASPTPDTGANSASTGPAPSFAGLGPLVASLVWSYFCFKLCLFVTLIPGAGFASVAEDFAKRKLSTLPLPLMRALSITLFFMMSSPVSSALRWLAGFGEQWLFAANALAAAFLVHLAMGATSLAFPAILKASWWAGLCHLYADGAALLFLSWWHKHRNA